MSVRSQTDGDRGDGRPDVSVPLVSGEIRLLGGLGEKASELMSVNASS